MKMPDWAAFLNSFLELSSYPILPDKGKVTALEAKLKAESEYEVYRKRQDAEYVSDFDRVVLDTKRLRNGRDAQEDRRQQRANPPRNHAPALEETTVARPYACGRAGERPPAAQAARAASIGVGSLRRPIQR